MSLASVDLKSELLAEPSSSGARLQPSVRPFALTLDRQSLTASQGDRFIASRPDFFCPLDTTPRTRRIANVLGFIEDRVLKFANPSSGTADSSEYNHLRSNFSQLLKTQTKVSPTSCVANLGSRKQFLLALDGPGVPADPFTYPLTWSRTNYIAVACGKDVYYQDLDSRVIAHLCKVSKQSHGRPTSVQWAAQCPNDIALGTTLGSVQLWSAETKQLVQEWRDEGWEAVGGMDWRDNVLAVGLDGGAIEMYDRRDAYAAHRLEMHRSKVHGVKWSSDGNYLASSDQQGIVYIWDIRAGKDLRESKRMGGRMKHGAPVKVSPLKRFSMFILNIRKALSWCPWQPDLLATGSTYPDGKIRIFSVKSTSPIPQPIQVLSLNSAITSLQWSPHSKELLSTHGTSWDPKAPRSVSGRPVAVNTPLTNSITVHSYPSGRRLLSVNAHTAAIGHSCLGPDGTMLFTVCPSEEAMKMWKVWGAPEKSARPTSSWDRFSIR